MGMGGEEAFMPDNETVILSPSRLRHVRTSLSPDSPQDSVLRSGEIGDDETTASAQSEQRSRRGSCRDTVDGNTSALGVLGQKLLIEGEARSRSARSRANETSSTTSTRQASISTPWTSAGEYEPGAGNEDAESEDECVNTNHIGKCELNPKQGTGNCRTENCTTPIGGQVTRSGINSSRSELEDDTRGSCRRYQSEPARRLLKEAAPQDASGPPQLEGNIPYVVQSAIQMWCKQQVKTDLDLLKVDNPDDDATKRAVSMYNDMLSSIRSQLDAGVYDEPVAVGSEATQTYVFKPYKVYKDLEQCIEELQSSDGATASHQREQLRSIKADFEDQFEKLLVRLEGDGCNMADLVPVSMECLASAQGWVSSVIGGIYSSVVG